MENSYHISLLIDYSPFIKSNLLILKLNNENSGV